MTTYDFLTALGTAAATLAIVFIMVIFHTLMGVLIGWCVGLVFDGTLALLAQALNMPEARPWQLGAILGFISGFFAERETKK